MKKILCFIITLIIFLLVMVSAVHSFNVLNNQLSVVSSKILSLEKAIDYQQKQNITIGKGILTVTEQVSEISDQIRNLRNESILLEGYENMSRGLKRLQPVAMRVTAYDLSYASCKKNPNHPEYGITKSGNPVREWYTIAAGPELSFGTQVFIPYFKNKPNGGIFTVQDRGSAIKENCIDVYMPNSKDCIDFGVKQLEVYVMD